MKKLITFLFVIAAVWGMINCVYMSGFDDGAAAAQCLDLIALDGSPKAMQGDACKDAAKAQRSFRFKVYGHRVFWK